MCKNPGWGCFVRKYQDFKRHLFFSMEDSHPWHGHARRCVRRQKCEEKVVQYSPGLYCNKRKTIFEFDSHGDSIMHELEMTRQRRCTAMYGPRACLSVPTVRSPHDKARLTKDYLFVSVKSPIYGDMIRRAFYSIFFRVPCFQNSCYSNLKRCRACIRIVSFSPWNEWKTQWSASHSLHGAQGMQRNRHVHKQSRTFIYMAHVFMHALPLQRVIAAVRTYHGTKSADNLKWSAHSLQLKIWHLNLHCMNASSIVLQVIHLALSSNIATCALCNVAADN